jgi:hypothetical protein
LKGKISAAFIILMLLGGVNASMLLVNASEAIEVSGTFTVTSTLIPPPKFAGDNMFVTYAGLSTWSGGITCAMAEGDQEWTLHFAGDPTSTPKPALLSINIKVKTTLYSATISDKTGDLTVKLIGTSDGSTTSGTWKIVDATGELENIHGNGIWERAAPTAPVFYSGVVHFDP